MSNENDTSPTTASRAVSPPTTQSGGGGDPDGSLNFSAKELASMFSEDGFRSSEIREAARQYALYMKLLDRVPKDKRKVYECATRVMEVATTAFPQLPSAMAARDVQNDAGGQRTAAWWRAGQAYRFIATLDAMAEWLGTTRLHTIEVVQKIADWFAANGLKKIHEPIIETVNRCIVLGNLALAKTSEKRFEYTYDFAADWNLLTASERDERRIVLAKARAKRERAKVLERDWEEMGR